jgi:carbon storage regulator
MLWLHRKAGDSVVIPQHDIEIVVGRIDGDTVRIGIDAPDSVDIHRRELWRRIQREGGDRVLGEGISTPKERND